MADEKFTDGILTWKDRRLDGRRREVDQKLGQSMGGSARSGLDQAITQNEATAANPKAKAATRHKAEIGASMGRRIQHVEGVQDRPTTINNVSRNYAAQFDSIMGSAAEKDAPSVPGTGWYFEHRRGAEASLPAGHELTSRQVSAMSAKLSASKTPEDERESMSGIHELTTKHARSMVNGQRVSDMTGEQLGAAASSEAAHSSFNSKQGGRRVGGAPEQTRPDTGGNAEVSDALRRAGRAHEPNVSVSVDVARGTVTPQEAFGHSTPKTAAYGEMIAQSDPGSLVETDYKGVSQHMLDVRKGKQMPGQGMMQFSKETPDTPTPHALSSDSPTAIDTWMFAAGSGQPASAPNVDPKTGEKSGGRDIRVSKRMTDKRMPLDAASKRKADVGLAGTDASIDAGAAASAQHMEAVTRAAKSFGAVSFDQHGNDIGVPSSLVQETVWTQHRRDAGADPEYAAQQRSDAAAQKASDKAAKAAAKQQQKLF